jgi:hypothetical protein
MMNIDAANDWPLMVVALPGVKALHNESAPPIFSQNLQHPTVLSIASEIDSDKFREKGSIIDIYI